MSEKASKKIWILSGEASGDIYGAALAQELMRLGEASHCPVKVSGMGGPRMKASGMEILVDSTELGVIGVVEILKQLFTFVRIFYQLVRTARERRPDAVVLIDYPTFNLMFAKRMYRAGIPVIWYVSPHVWVWGKKRIGKLAKFCRKMLVIFPFEPEVYANSGLDTEFVGHPLVDMVHARRDASIVRDDNLFLLLPGSRSMEINFLLNPMLDCVAELHQRHTNLRFVLSTPRERIAERCREIIGTFRQKHPEKNLPEIKVACGKTEYYQQAAGTGLAASGTVTVESAIAGLPLVVVYRLKWLTLLLASILVKLYRNSFTMVNIIAGKKVFEEFLQHHVNAAELVPAIERILPGGSERNRVEREMQEVTALLSGEAYSMEATPQIEAASIAVGQSSECLPCKLGACERAAGAVWRTVNPVGDSSSAMSGNQK